jgi:hypothetical protein
MVGGLFPREEQDAVLSVLERSVVLLTPVNIADVIRDGDWLHTTWHLANLYLASVGAELLGPDARAIVGLSEETTCYITPEYFARRGRFDDFIVHEAAHAFHNCKRHTMGLQETRAGVAPRHRLWKARDVCLRLRGVQSNPRARFDSDGKTGAGRRGRPAAPAE